MSGMFDNRKPVLDFVTCSHEDTLVVPMSVCAQCDVALGRQYSFFVAPVVEKKKETILEEAAWLVNGPRRAEYGHPKVNFSQIAAMWQTLFQEKLCGQITADDVALAMILLKVCRGKQGYKKDTATDLAGYAQCWELVNE
jgi:Domain of unknown function (DUF6378)